MCWPKLRSASQHRSSEQAADHRHRKPFHRQCSNNQPGQFSEGRPPLHHSLQIACQLFGATEQGAKRSISRRRCTMPRLQSHRAGLTIRNRATTGPSTMHFKACGNGQSKNDACGVAYKKELTEGCFPDEYGSSARGRSHFVSHSVTCVDP